VPTNDASCSLSRISPQEEYGRRLSERGEEIRKHEGRENLAGQARVASFLAIFAVAYVLSSQGAYFYIGILLAVTAFVGSIAWHRRVVRALERAKIAARYYATAIARLNDNWAGTGPDGQCYRSSEHLYAGDVDLFGRGSLFQLLCAARTPMGQDTLAAWLMKPADTETIHLRQAAIEELRGELDLREELAVIDAPSKANFLPAALLQWTAAPPMLADRARPVIAVILSLISTAALVGWLFFHLGGIWFWGIALLQGIFLFTMREKIKKITRNIDSVLGNLNLLVEVLRILESQRFQSTLLQDIDSLLHISGQTPSRRIERLARLVDYWETMRLNTFVMPFAFIWMLYVHLAYAIERWRIVHGKLVAEWLQAVGEFEALSSLAAFAFEHPEFPFAEISEEGPAIDAQKLGHPLIPSKRRMTNEITLDTQRQLLLVSGSNMSGKSTLLRTIGLNAAIALAGGPVCASRLRITPLAIASSMRNMDSLQDGVSAFYAEIQRLRAVCNLTNGKLPVLFLLDEILHGTNSHDRRVGAEVVIKSLLKQKAIGLITTHDLALAEIVEKLGTTATNVHFEDQLIDGRLHFDYRLRPGVVPKGNGLVLMRLLGFEV
jgi:hypothetical protein